MSADEVFAYIKKEYGSEPEFLWARYPKYAVFRHADNRKWFAIIMDVPKNRFGLETGEIVDVLNVKIGDPLFKETLITQPGIYNGYHISSGNWVSVFLDGTVPMEEIRGLLAESYAVTEIKKKMTKKNEKKGGKSCKKEGEKG